MSESFVIRQPAGQRTLALRESYLAICEGDACAAHLLNAMERWYVYKLKERDQNRGKNKAARQGGEAEDADESLWVRMNAEGWSLDLLGLYNEKTIRNKLAALVEFNYIATRSNPKRKWDRTPQWLFRRGPVQEAVDNWEATRTQSDLDPDFEWENDVLVQSDTVNSGHTANTSECSRTIVRMESVKVPNGVGKSSECIRENVRDNNTGVLTQESFTDIQNSGVLPVIENARASVDTQPSTQPVVTTQVPYTTTVEAAPETTPELIATPTPPVAVLSPEGEAAHAAQATLDLSQQDFDELFQEPVINQATTPEKVPPAAPRPEMTSARPSMEALTPIPQDELLSRPPAVAGDESYRLIRALVGGESRLSALLLQPTPTGGIDRERWLRLTHAEVSAVKAAAQASAQAAEGSMMTLVIRGLDRLIGAGDGKAGGKVETVALPGAYATKEEKQAQLAVLSALPEIAEGSTWRSLKTGKSCTVEEVRDGAVFFADGSVLSLQLFHRSFEPMGGELWLGTL